MTAVKANTRLLWKIMSKIEAALIQEIYHILSGTILKHWEVSKHSQ